MRRGPLLGVFLLAAAVRLGHVQVQGPPPAPVADALDYVTYAASLAESGRYEGPRGDRASRMPGYPLFLAAVRSAAGPSMVAVQWVQALLGAATCVVLLLWLARLAPPPWPTVLAALAAVYYDLVAPSAWILSEALFSFLLVCSFACARAGPSPALSAAAGLAFGATSLVRPEIAPFAGLMLVLSPLLARAWRWRDAALAVVLFAAPLTAWTIRNALVLGRFVPTTTTSGYNIYMGFHIPLERLGLLGIPRHRPPEGLGELERDADYLAAYGPLRDRTPYLHHVKARLFNAAALYYPFLPEYDWTYVLLAPLWLIGLAAALRRPELRPAAGCVAFLSLVYALLSGPVSRYRFGFAPCLFALAAGGGVELERRFGLRRVLAAAGAWALFNGAVWLWAPRLRAAVLTLRALVLE